MKLATDDLKTKVAAAIVRSGEKANESYVEESKRYDLALDKYLASDKPARLLETLRDLAKRAGRGAVITDRELDRLSPYSDQEKLGFHRSERPEAPSRVALPPRLAVLRDFLDTVTDDEISTSTLRDLGFRNLAEILGA